MNALSNSITKCQIGRETAHMDDYTQKKNTDVKQSLRNIVQAISSQYQYKYLSYQGAVSPGISAIPKIVKYEPALAHRESTKDLKRYMEP